MPSVSDCAPCASAEISLADRRRRQHLSPLQYNPLKPLVVPLDAKCKSSSSNCCVDQPLQHPQSDTEEPQRDESERTTFTRSRFTPARLSHFGSFSSPFFFFFFHYALQYTVTIAIMNSSHLFLLISCFLGAASPGTSKGDSLRVSDNSAQSASELQPDGRDQDMVSQHMLKLYERYHREQRLKEGNTVRSFRANQGMWLRVI